jgi:hypothetical protein
MGRWKKFIEEVQPWQIVAGAITAIVLFLIGAHAWVSKVARDAVQEEKFLASLAERVRPTCIFTSREAVEADNGTADYIQKISVTPYPEKYGFKVTITAKRHLKYAPMVQCLDANLFAESTVRSGMHDWVITLTPRTTTNLLLADDGAPNTNEVYRFKLEILH